MLNYLAGEIIGFLLCIWGVVDLISDKHNTIGIWKMIFGFSIMMILFLCKFSSIPTTV